MDFECVELNGKTFLQNRRGFVNGVGVMNRKSVEFFLNS
jgi:hypothetical protein